MPTEPRGRTWERASLAVSLGLALVPFAIFVWGSVDRRWMSEDGFINLRIVQNVLDGYGPVFKEVAPRLPRPDLALVPIGAYEPRPLMRGSHCTPEEGVELGRDWGAKRLCGMHWGTIQLTDEPPFEPPGLFRAAALAAGYAEEDAWTLAMGETKRL